MTVELFKMVDDEGVRTFYFVDHRRDGTLVASECFVSERDAREYMAMTGGAR